MGIYFAQEGCKIVLWDINEKGLEAVAKEIKTAGGTVATYKCDVSNREMIYQVAAQVKKEHGSVNIVVNNAGVVCGDYFMDIKDENTEKLMKINVLGKYQKIKI